MKLKQLHSLAELEAIIGTEERAFLLLYKHGSDISQCALTTLEALAPKAEFPLLVADVSTVRDIHPHYGISSAPSLLEFRGGELKNILKGCQHEQVLRAYFEQAVFVAPQTEGAKPTHSVTVYSTPTCSWCNTLKAYLRNHSVKFTEIDVSRDEQAAKDMVARSGQQGVPQSLIDGQVVVGFDQKRIDSLLGIQ